MVIMSRKQNLTTTNNNPPDCTALYECPGMRGGHNSLDKLKEKNLKQPLKLPVSPAIPNTK